MTIGIFDSGRGGRFVAEAFRRTLPDHELVVVDDRANAPYGNKPYATIERLTHAAIRPLLATCDIVVLACNTATAAAIDSLRTMYPDTIFVGFEPMIKPAASATVTNHITLLATAATSAAPRTRQLIDTYAPATAIDTPDTTDWARLIDAGKSNEIDLSAVAKSIKSGSDVIVVGCTHYIALLPRLRELAPQATILEPSQAVAERITQLIASTPQ